MCIRDSIITENATEFSYALELLRALDEDIKSRLKQYSYCISKSTENYLNWLKEEYVRKLRQLLAKSMTEMES